MPPRRVDPNETDCCTRGSVFAQISPPIEERPNEFTALDYPLTTQFRQAVTQAQINALVGSGLLEKADYVFCEC